MSTDGFDVMSVLIQGDCVGEELANLRVTAGRYPDDAESVYLIWVDSLPLRAGDAVEVTIQEEGSTLHPGHLFSEKSSNEPQKVEGNDVAPVEQVFAQLRSMQRVRERFRLLLETNHGTQYSAETETTEHGFGFTVLWNRLRPVRARLSLHSFTLDALEQQTPMQYRVSEYIEPFTTVRFQVST